MHLQTRLQNLRPINVGGPIAPITGDDNLLGEMLDSSDTESVASMITSSLDQEKRLVTASEHVNLMADERF